MEWTKFNKYHSKIKLGQDLFKQSFLDMLLKQSPIIPTTVCKTNEAHREISTHHASNNDKNNLLRG